MAEKNERVRYVISGIVQYAPHDFQQLMQSYFECQLFSLNDDFDRKQRISVRMVIDRLYESAHTAQQTCMICLLKRPNSDSCRECSK
jgi:hypothetical protein